MTGSPSLGDILIVDDDSNITDLLRVNLRSKGYGVSVCPIAEDVDRKALDSTVLVIVDAMRQAYSGLDLIYDLKEDPDTEHMAVILYSPIKSERMVIDALDAGADDFNAEDNVFEITTDPDAFNDVVKALEEKNYAFVSADISLVPQTYVKLESDEDIKNMEKLLDMLDDNEDVQNTYHNWDQD